MSERLPRRLVVLALLVAGCAGCSGLSAPAALRHPGEKESAEPSQPSPQEIVVTRVEGAFPVGCGPREVAELVAGCLGAFNRGEQPALARYVFGVAPVEVSPRH